MSLSAEDFMNLAEVLCPELRGTYTKGTRDRRVLRIKQALRRVALHPDGLPKKRKEKTAPAAKYVPATRAVYPVTYRGASFGHPIHSSVLSAWLSRLTYDAAEEQNDPTWPSSRWVFGVYPIHKVEEGTRWWDHQYTADRSFKIEVVAEDDETYTMGIDDFLRGLANLERINPRAHQILVGDGSSFEADTPDLNKRHALDNLLQMVAFGTLNYDFDPDIEEPSEYPQ